MKRRQLMMNLIAIFSVLIQACGSKGPTPNDILGTWITQDGAILQINSDSSFIGKSLPAQYFTFFTSKSEVEGKRVDGKGKWKLEEGQGFTEIKLHFTNMNNTEMNGFYSVLVAGEKGALENKPPWYLFLWKDEEGGERYKFVKNK
jgi:hypothetical protein